MHNEEHRRHCIAAFQEYECGDLPYIHSVRVSDLARTGYVDQKPWERVVYFLRLDSSRSVEPSVSAIPNRNDKKNILYIGGHSKPSGGSRYNVLINSCRKAQETFEALGYAKNDMAHPHPVAGCLTTSLLETGFRIEDCLLDIVSASPKYDELEFIIGYQEKYHQLPPWNSNRKGNHAFGG